MWLIEWECAIDRDEDFPFDCEFGEQEVCCWQREKSIFEKSKYALNKSICQSSLHKIQKCVFTNESKMLFWLLSGVELCWVDCGNSYGLEPPSV